MFDLVRSAGTSFDCLAERIDASHHWNSEKSGFQIDGQFRARLRPKREITVTRHDEQTDLLPLWNHLIIGLKVEGHLIEFTRYQRLALGE